MLLVMGGGGGSGEDTAMFIYKRRLSCHKIFNVSAATSALFSMLTKTDLIVLVSVSSWGV